jgi:hypothetical protein
VENISSACGFSTKKTSAVHVVSALKKHQQCIVVSALKKPQE